MNGASICKRPAPARPMSGCWAAPGTTRTRARSCSASCAMRPANDMHWCSKAVRRRGAQGQSRDRPGERAKLYEQADQAVYDDVPLVRFADVKAYVPVRKNVAGFKLHFLGGQPFGGVSLEGEYAMQLALATWQEVEEYLRPRAACIIPIGSAEQHGPNGLIGTDHLDAEFVAKGVGDAIGCLVAPTLAIGMSQHHLGFTGSVTLRPSTLIAVVGDVVQSLRRHGFERFLFINGHGGNVATVTAAFDEIYAAASLRRGRRADPLQDGVLVGRPALQGAGGGAVRRRQRQPRHRRGGFAVAALPSAARSSTRRCRPRSPRSSDGFYRQRRLPPPLRRRAHRLRPVALHARARRAHLCTPRSPTWSELYRAFMAD